MTLSAKPRALPDLASHRQARSTAWSLAASTRDRSHDERACRATSLGRTSLLISLATHVLVAILLGLCTVSVQRDCGQPLVGFDSVEIEPHELERLPEERIPPMLAVEAVAVEESPRGRSVDSMASLVETVIADRPPGFADELAPLATARPGEFDGNGAGGTGGDPRQEAAFRKLLYDVRKNGLDIVLTFDSTGSMGREIAQVKKKIYKIGADLAARVPMTRIGICTYRDFSDDYVVKGLPLSDDLAVVRDYLNGVTAAGGGDYPESVLSGLKWSIEKNEFRPAARKVILLFGDAPPHAREQEECQRLARRFHREQGGIVNTISCRKNAHLQEFAEIAYASDGETFLLKDHRLLMQELVVLIFGSEHRESVLRMFDLADTSE